MKITPKAKELYMEAVDILVQQEGIKMYPLVEGQNYIDTEYGLIPIEELENIMVDMNYKEKESK
jgi:hypothetical protein